MNWIITLSIIVAILVMAFLFCGCKAAGRADRHAEQQYKIWIENKNDNSNK